MHVEQPGGIRGGLRFAGDEPDDFLIKGLRSNELG
jgi:hypothetical protein